MKKLMLAMAAAALTAVSYGSACSWTMTNVYQPGTTDQSNGYLAYLFIEDATITGTSYITSLIDAGTSIASLAKSTGSTSAGKINIAGVEAGLAASTAYTAFAVIFDAESQDKATNYMVTKEVTKNVNAMGASVAFGFGTQAASTWTSTSAVPEPTSGLLLLLGMAGLALKRKRA